MMFPASDGVDQAEEAHLDLLSGQETPPGEGRQSLLGGLIGDCSQQQRDQQAVVVADHDNGSLCYEEHNGVIEIGLDAKIVPTFSFEEIRNQIEEKWKEEIKSKMAEVRVFLLLKFSLKIRPLLCLRSRRERQQSRVCSTTRSSLSRSPRRKRRR